MLKKIGLVFAGLIALVVALVAYTAARHIVFWSPTEEVVFASGEITLAGTLIKPAGTGVFPAVVMLHGSGPETRGDPSYRAHAKALVRSGSAVLLYDKRGTGTSGGDFDAALYEDFIADAKAAVGFLAGRDDVDADRIGLLGNSEGGWFTPEIAAASPGVAFIINRVGPPLSWIDTGLWEVRNEFLAEGAADGDLETLLVLTRQRWDYLRAAATDPTLAQGSVREALEAAIREIRAAVPLADQLVSELPAYSANTYRRFTNYSYDPAPYLREIDIPMLYIFGELDVNVPTAESVAFLESLREEYQKNITIHVILDVGHALFTWKGLLGAGYPPGYLDLVGSWAADQVDGD